MALPLNYHWRNLFARKTTTLLTLLVVAAVVGTLAWILGFAAALRDSLAVAADPRKLIVVQRGTNSETNSSISPEDFNRLMNLTEAEPDPATNEPLISRELYWQTQLPRVRDGGRTRANVALRGVTEIAFKVHRNVKRLGRSFSTGAPEAIVGVSAAKQFQGLNIGDTLKLGFGDNREFKIVGHFSADGGPLESEIWLYLPTMQSAYQRTSYSSASLRLREGVDPKDALAKIEGPTIQLGGQTEAAYWDTQAQNVRIYQMVCYILVAMMTLAAVFSIANTMFATVAGRTREIAMLRTIGFAPGRILMGFVFEAVLLSLLGGILGVLGCLGYLALMGSAKDMFGANTFTALAFEIRLTPLLGLILGGAVVIVGVLGALFPAWRASRTQVIAALREA